MPDEKNLYEALPIPSYDEATQSSPSSSRRDSDSHEREGLLGPDPSARIPVPTRRAGYVPPTVEDAVDEDEQETFLGQDHEHDGHEEEGEVRREMEELEIEEPRELSAWGKRISSLSQTLRLGSLPFKWKWKPRIPFPTMGWPNITADFCIVLGRCFAILLVMAVVYLLFMSDIFTSSIQRMAGQGFDPEDVRMFVQGQVDPHRIRDNLRKVTNADHIAGTEGDFFLASYVEKFMKEMFLDDVRMEQFGVYLNYPREGGRKVEILNDDGSVKWGAKVEEDQMYTDRQQTLVFHGHSRSGDVTGPLIYANYGSREDFKHLYDRGIDTKGAIALVKYYGSLSDRSLKVKAAELAGFAGCLMYSDPADDGFGKGDVAPNGRYMPEGGVQRGSVAMTSYVVGDPLTPGWASIDGAKRVSKDNNPGLNNIPSLPLSWGDAKHLMETIKGFGEAAPDEWKGGIPNMEYWSGNLSSPRVRLLNDQDEVEQQQIWNVLGKINGVEQKEKSVIIGNHRDAWAFGASDPGSGTAVFLEVIKVFGDLVAHGWRPLRTIEFASWDAEEYNLVGSTEHVENDMERLRQDGYAYLNVDVAVGGTKFVAAGSPVFKKSLLRVLDRVSDPNQNKTIRQLWDERNGQIDGLGAGSDYVAFQDMAGTSSLDIGFDGPPFPYHSVYDNFEWMSSVGDPGFEYHKLLAQIWVLLILEFSDRLVLPFDISDYSASLTQWSIELAHWTENKGANQPGNMPFSLEPLKEAVLEFAKDSGEFEKWERVWDATVLGGGGFESAVMAAHRKSHNNRMANFETHLLDLEEGGGVSFLTLR